jgi:hypothetical protein
MNTTAQMRTDPCDECGQMKPAFGFTLLSSEGGGPGRKLCSECCNREYMHRAGLPELENQNSTRAGASPDLGLDLNRLGNTGSVLISRRRAEDARR